jgi:ribose 5-phosphate isomerase B
LRLAFGADDTTPLTDALIDALRLRGHEVEVVGLPAGDALGWADVARNVGEMVVLGRADRGIVCCWTGTGVSIAANKVPGVRAALCADAETARGARLWNDANVLCLSLRSTSEAVGREILDAWLSTNPDGSETENIEKVRAMDTARGPL